MSLIRILPENYIMKIRIVKSIILNLVGNPIRVLGAAAAC